ncbi:DUF5977 domain-containing protein [Chryseobacterium sp. 18068]|uniref:DUF5977 domain-containing protein n=1 Tax=Chryseobacterium sp. 18068 TaxID=2681414 RepID=UPI00135B9652|nr:DUF5977 domain-containing protein [Chryseobacterium sp. 18068]
MKIINTIIKLILLCFIACLGNLTYAQNYSNYYFPEPPKAPSSEAFLKYGDIQNSEYTGTNSPSINLFNLKSGDISLPVNLNYISGNGIRVTEEAGQVGLGWGMSFPTIVQNIYGYDDFSNSVHSRLDFAKSSLPYANNFPIASGPTNFNQVPSFDTFGYFMAYNNNVPKNGSFTNLAQDYHLYDMQPDIFIMNLFGEKIEFIISNFPNYTISNNSPIYFTSLNKKGYEIKKTAEGFEVKDPKGFTYKFNNTERITAVPGGLQGQNFLITEITDTNNNSIYFNYLNILDVNNPVPKSWFLNYTTSFSNYTYTSGIGGLGTTGDLDLAGTGTLGSYTNPNRFNSLGRSTATSSTDIGSKQNYLLPLTITGDNGKLIFNYSDRIDFGTKKLDKISLFTNNILINECQFIYDYFLSQTVDETPLINNIDKNKRLKLISIQKINEEKYSFVYNETLLPHKNSYATDYWGYSNGGFSNKTAHLNPNDFNYNVNIPVISNPTIGHNEFNNNNKLSNDIYTKSAILEKIYYPTKGYSKFIYEGNEASNLFDQFHYYKYNKGNGLRLSKQENYDYNNNILNTTLFEYQNGITPNPKKVFRQDNGEIFVTYNTCVLPVNNICDIETLKGSFVSMSSSSVSNTYSLSSGSGVGYSKVIRKELDASGNSKGRIENIYSNSEDTYFNISDYNRPIFLPSVKGNKKENGSLLNKSIFDSNNVKLNEEKYNYVVQNSDFSYGVVMIHPMFQILKLQDGAVTQNIKSAIGYYPIYSTETILTDKENTEYINGDSLITRTDLAYNSNNFITFKSLKFPDGKWNLEKTKYSTEKSNIKLINSNILNVPLEKEIIGNVINGSSKRTSLVETKYDDPNHLNPTSVISYDINISNGQNIPTTEVTYDLYDNKGNLLQYTTKSGIPTTVIWGYNQTQIIAKIEGGSYSQIMQAFGLDPNNAASYLQLEIVSKSDLDIDTSSEDILLSKLDIFKKKTEFKDFNVTTYTYDPLIGVKTITSDSGFREFYKYNAQNKLEKIVDSENNILKEFKYNYAPRLYYNSVQSQPFTRNNCGSGAIGGIYTYTVQENIYSSYDSQAAADQQAQNEINANGQNSANTNGPCTPINCYLSMYIGGGGSVSVLNQNYRVQLGFSSGVGRPWTTTGVIIGKINGTCIPQTEKTISSYSGGYIWEILVKTNGELHVKKLEGLGSTGVPNNTSYNLDFTFPIN